MSNEDGFKSGKWRGRPHEFIDAVGELRARGVRVFCFQTPLAKNIANLSDFEKERIKGWRFDFNNVSEEDYRCIARVYENNVDIRYLKKVYDGTKVFSRNNVRYLADFRSGLVNVVNGERHTVGQPADCKRSVYVYGQCTARGSGVEDKDTIPSLLQGIINAKIPGYGISVRNKAIGCGSDIHDDVAHVKEDRPRRGDAAVFCTDLRGVPRALFEENGVPYHDCSPLFNRPHGHGEWFTDATFHTTPAGNRAIAGYIFETLERGGGFENDAGEPAEAPVSAGPDPFVDGAQIRPFLETLKGCRKGGPKRGAIIMNCNPLTKGHLHLIETAAAQVDWLFIFVVEEDRSFFAFEDRMGLVSRGTGHIRNVTVLPSGRFVLSADTFPGYFYKDADAGVSVDASMDVRIFGKYIAPALGITVRFVGEEPLDPVTAAYNRQMREILPGYGVEVREMPRKGFDGAPISASRVRELLKEGSFDKIKDIVPEVTYEFLVEGYGGSAGERAMQRM